MQKIAMSFLFFLLSGAIVFYYAKPSYERIGVMHKENAALEVVLDEMRGLVEKKNELEDLYNSISESDLKKLDALAPSSPRIADFLIRLDLLSTRNGLHFSSINFSKETVQTEETFNPWSFSTQLKGTYDSFRNYLKDIEKFIRIIDVDTVGFTAPNKPGDPMGITFTAKMYQSK